MGRFGGDNRGGSRSFDRPRFGGGNSFGGGSSFGGGRGGDRPMFKTVCSNCGKDCEVPFRPTNGKPVYCSECFEKMGNARPDSGRNDFERTERPNPRFQAPVFDQTGARLDALNVKLERILKILETKIPTPEVVATVPEEEVKVKIKAKKSPIKK